MQKFKFSYDEENDDLFIHRSNSKSKGSVEFGDMVLDFDSKKELVGLEIMNASGVIKEFVAESSIDVRKLLINLHDCRIENSVNNNLLIIRLFLSSKTVELKPIFSVPRIGESPSLSYA